MYIETIRIQDGRVRNIAYHNDRCNRTREMIYGSSTSMQLRSAIDCPTELVKGITKCRITYAEHIIKVEYEPYELKPISSLKLVQADHVDYQHKASDRSALLDLFSKKGSCDDIIMLKDQRLTDTYYGNIALLKNGRWYTPERPMLAGTMRAHLIARGSIIPKSIIVSEIQEYEQITVFNAMIPMGNVQLAIASIY